MSESNSGNEPDESGQGISDDQLPDDLNPDKNPLADPEGKGAGDGLQRLGRLGRLGRGHARHGPARLSPSQ